ncbi:winged helix-turn-helix domain-containing protein [Thermoproteota archaeon]
MAWYQDVSDEAEISKIREKHGDFLEETNERLIPNMLRFSRKDPITQRKITRNKRRGKIVNENILTLLRQGPHSFTDIHNSIGGSRTTISNHLKGLCEKNVRKNPLTRKYELNNSQYPDLRTINIPSNAYATVCDRQINKGRLEVNEKIVAKFFPHKGFNRIDEAKPKIKKAVAYLLDPVYNSYTLPFRKPQEIEFEIEINLTVKGTLKVGMTEHQLKASKFNEKMKMMSSDERLSY